MLSLFAYIEIVRTNTVKTIYNWFKNISIVFLERRHYVEKVLDGHLDR